MAFAHWILTVQIHERPKPRVLREVADVLAKLLATVFEKTRGQGESLRDQITFSAFIKKGPTEGPCQPASLQSQGKTMEWLLVEDISGR